MDTDKIYAESIANQYSAKKDSKVIALKKLDARAKRPARVFTWAFGTVSALVLGAGMCLAMNVIGDGTTASMGIGVAVGLAGIAGMLANYPIYKKIRDNGKQKYAYDVIKLAQEISEG